MIAKHWKQVGRFFLAGVLLPVLVIGCATEAPSPPAYVSTPASSEGSLGSAQDAVTSGIRSRHPASRKLSVAPPEPEPVRPGLGTGWGRPVRSELGYTSFNRASSKPYRKVATIYYNDREGVNAMTSWKSSASRMQSAAGGLVEWGVSSDFGLLKNYNGSGRRFVVGKEDQRYTLVVKNKAKSRLEVVLSVDGLDVMDGKTASLKKRGYIIEPGKTLRVKGWRTSAESVASFRFSGVSNSYSNLRHGETRNVGVIGLAVFTERGVDPWIWKSREVDRRHAASPFAEPPLYRAR